MPLGVSIVCVLALFRAMHLTKSEPGRRPTDAAASSAQGLHDLHKTGVESRAVLRQKVHFRGPNICQ